MRPELFYYSGIEPAALNLSAKFKKEEDLSFWFYDKNIQLENPYLTVFRFPNVLTEYQKAKVVEGVLKSLHNNFNEWSFRAAKNLPTKKRLVEIEHYAPLKVFDVLVLFESKKIKNF